MILFLYIVNDTSVLFFFIISDTRLLLTVDDILSNANNTLFIEKLHKYHQRFCVKLGNIDVLSTLK